MSANTNQQQIAQRKPENNDNGDLPTYRELRKMHEELNLQLQNLNAELLRDHGQLIQLMTELFGPKTFRILEERLEEVKKMVQGHENWHILRNLVHEGQATHHAKTLKRITELPEFDNIDTNVSVTRDLIQNLGKSLHEDAKAQSESLTKILTQLEEIEKKVVDKLRDTSQGIPEIRDSVKLIQYNTLSTEEKIGEMKEKLPSLDRLANIEEYVAGINDKLAPLVRLANIEAEVAMSRGMLETTSRNSTQVGRYFPDKVTEIEQRQARLEHLAEYSGILLGETEERILGRLSALEQKLEPHTPTAGDIAGNDGSRSLELLAYDDTVDSSSGNEVVAKGVVDESELVHVPATHDQTTFANVALGFLISLSLLLLLNLLSFGWDVETAIEYWVASNLGWFFLPFARTICNLCVFERGVI